MQHRSLRINHVSWVGSKLREKTSHAVAPYAVRAIEGAQIATPLSWDELADHQLNEQSFTMKNIFQHVSPKSDPWKNLHRFPCSLKIARRRLDQIIKKEQVKR